MSWDNELYYVVSDAVRSGVDPDDFKRKLAQLWESELRKRADDEPQQFLGEKE